MLLTRLRIGTHGIQTTPVGVREMDGGTLGCGHGRLLVCEWLSRYDYVNA